ncbi:MAG: hypothetical protein DWQ37_03320 [Planctomycetota bacterium]|nr:MAG: hypothetical protein DWQ37_03320 [Planctomycetota bacterium]
MSLLDWLVVLVLNGSIIVFALVWGGGTKTSSEWFLAGRSLPWWMVGLSMYATFIDASDLVVDSGGAYQFGMRMFVLNWVGVVAGWLLLANVVGLAMYRAGMYTNAEYLEARFGLGARVISVLVQVQFRTMVLGIMAQGIFLTLVIVLGWSENVARTAVVAIAVVAIIYTMTGGLRAVALTDALQSIVMLVASIIVFVLVFNHVGGWTGVHERLRQHDPAEAAHMLEVGHPRLDRTDTANKTDDEIDDLLLLGGEHVAAENAIVRSTPAWVFCLSLVIAGMAYSIVNHTQSMRLLGAKTEWDLKMSVVLASAVLVVMTFVNLSLGVMGRALHPTVALLDVPAELRGVDAIYPVLVRDLTASGLRGIVVAGIMAAAFSTFDSIGSALSALITRDLYARLFVTNADDHHYLWVGRWLTPAIILGSFLYLPLLNQGMFAFYLEMVAAFVTPLLTVYLMGALTPVHRRSATVGLLVGVAYGIWGLLASWSAANTGTPLLPSALANPHVAAPMSVLVTATSMVLVSLWWGWTPPGDILRDEDAGWLRDSQGQVRPHDGSVSGRTPLVLGAIVLAAGVGLSFVVFW